MRISRATPTPHLLDRLAIRGLVWLDVSIVLHGPDEVVAGHLDRLVAQRTRAGRMTRVVVAMDSDPPRVLTASRTSRPERYRRRS